MVADFGLDGNLYVAGVTEGNLNGETNNGGDDIFVIKLDSDGNEIWTKLYGTSSDDWIGEISFREDGFLYLEGTSYGYYNHKNYNGFLKKIDTKGEEVWTKYFGSSFDDESGRLKITNEGSIYVLGRTEGGSFKNNPAEGGTDAFLLKFDDKPVEKFKLLGEKLYGDANGDFLGFATALSGNGNVIATAAPFSESNRGTIKTYQINNEIWKKWIKMNLKKKNRCREDIG